MYEFSSTTKGLVFPPCKIILGVTQYSTHVHTYIHVDVDPKHGKFVSLGYKISLRQENILGTHGTFY